MPTPISIFPGGEDEGVNFRLWIGILLPPFAGGVNTLVGYMVSNYDCNVHNRRLVLLVNAISAVLCAIAAIIALSTREKVRTKADDKSEALLHSRLFMLHLGLWFSAGFLLLVIAGSLSTFLLGPCDL
jgi:Na+/proline symporter